MGFTTLEGQYGPSIAIGGVDLAPAELVYGYSVLANGGVMVGQESVAPGKADHSQLQPVSILRVLDSSGQVRFDAEKETRRRRIVPEEHAFLITDILKDPRATCVTFGCGGIQVPGYQVAVFSDDGTRVPANAQGEIGVRGAGLFSAYYAPWLLCEHLTRQGWFMTGDIGRLDASGALYLAGRKKAVIFVAGLKFFPEEVEACIDEFPGVRESRVYGRAHPHLGEVPCAEIVPAASGCDLEALRTHCTRALSSYKVPVEFTVIDAIPRTPGGKILRRSAMMAR